MASTHGRIIYNVLWEGLGSERSDSQGTRFLLIRRRRHVSLLKSIQERAIAISPTTKLFIPSTVQRRGAHVLTFFNATRNTQLNPWRTFHPTV